MTQMNPLVQRQLLIKLFRDALTWLEAESPEPPPEDVVNLLQEMQRRRRPPAA